MSSLCPENVHIVSIKFLKICLKCKHSKGIYHGHKSDISCSPPLIRLIRGGVRQRVLRQQHSLPRGEVLTFIKYHHLTLHSFCSHTRRRLLFPLLIEERENLGHESDVLNICSNIELYGLILYNCCIKRKELYA